jgi:hypothetical protein
MHPPPLRKLIAEVIGLEFDAIWQAFAETGDPVCYMLYKAVNRDRRDNTDSGEAPRVTD